MSDNAVVDTTTGNETTGGGEIPAWFQEFQSETTGAFQHLVGQLQALQASRGGEDEDDEPRRRPKKGASQQQQQAQRNLDQSWLNEFLDTIVEQRVKGNAMPLTTRIGVKTGELEQILHEQGITIEQLQQQIAMRSNPTYEADMRTFGEMDNMMLTELEELYGAADPHMHDMVAEKVKAYLDEMRQEHPDTWQRVRRSTELQQRIVKAHIAQAIPPRARAMLQAQAEARTEISQGEYRQALLEVKQLPPELRERGQAIVRRAILERRR